MMFSDVVFVDIDGAAFSSVFRLAIRLIICSGACLVIFPPFEQGVDSKG